MNRRFFFAAALAAPLGAALPTGGGARRPSVDRKWLDEEMPPGYRKCSCTRVSVRDARTHPMEHLVVDSDAGLPLHHCIEVDCEAGTALVWDKSTGHRCERKLVGNFECHLQANCFDCE